MKRVKFIADFGIKRIGDVCEYDGQLARQLIDIDQVAEETTDDLTLVLTDREYLEPGTISTEEIEVNEPVVEEPKTEEHQPEAPKVEETTDEKPKGKK